MVLISSYPGPIFRHCPGPAIPVLWVDERAGLRPLYGVWGLEDRLGASHTRMRFGGILPEDRGNAGWYGLL